MTASTNYIAYYRVSTGKQALSFEAQGKTVSDYVMRMRGCITAEFTEIETGTSKRRRVEVYKALARCREEGATLIVAKLDRLARDMEFMGAIMKMDIDIVFCDFPAANKLMIGFMAAFAQYEAELISQRTKDALAVLKRNGVVLGNPEIGKQSAKGLAARDRTPDPNSPNSQAVGMILNLRNSGKTYPEIAKALNDNNMRTTYDKAFTQKTVERLYLNEKKRIQSSSK